MLINKAESYLKEVLEHKKCIPFSRYDHSMGRTGQAKNYGLTKGRWPEKSIKYILNLLQNAKANAESKKLNVEKLAIKRVVVNHAMKGRRRTYRAHGSITAYLSSNCHVEIFCEEVKERVKKEKKQIKDVHLINPRKLIRKALAKAYAKKKYVAIGGEKK